MPEHHLIRTLIWRIVVLMCCLCSSAGAATPLEIPTDLERLSLSSALDIHEDTSGNASLAEVLQHGRFEPVSPRRLTPGFSAHAFWLHLRLHNPSPQARTVWLQIGNPRQENVELFQMQDGQWQSQSAGIAHPFASYPLKTSTPVFPLRLQPGEERELFWRVTSRTGISMEALLWTPEAFRTDESGFLLVRGLELGALTVLGLYSLLQFFSIGQRGYGYYGVSVLFLVGYELGMTGLGFRFLWPTATGWATWSAAFCMNISLVNSLLFFRSLTNTHQWMPRLDQILLTSIVGLSALTLLTQCIDYRTGAQMGTQMGLLITLALPGMGLWAMVRVPDTGWAYTVAMLLMGIGNLTRVLEALGLRTPDAWTIHGVPLACMGGTFLILIACTQQVKRLRQKEEATTRTLLIFRQQERDRLEEQVKARTQELKLAMEAAQAANQAKSGLLAHISHDLRAPLATIIAYARHPGESEAELHSSRKAIENNAYNQLELIDELIDYSSCELGMIPLHVVPGSWSSFAEGLVSDAHQLARAHGNQLIFNSPDVLPPVIHADFRRLRRILMNLLSNAAKYTKAGNIFFDVRRVHRTEQNSQINLEFVVTDSGIGMSEETLSRLFSPFTRGDNALTQEGTGLGLIIARDLVRAMGGRLTINSALGQGSRFSFVLSFRSAEQTQDAPAALPSPAAATPRRLDGRITQPSILILDTSGSSLTATLQHLQGAGYRTLKAEHSVVALQLLDQHPVDLLIVADNIPADDGWDVLTAAHAHHPPIPSLLHVSGAAGRPDGRPASLCFDAELPQTAPPSQLLETIQALLDTGPFGRPLDKPDPGSLNTLREMVANGQVSDIELWVREQLHSAPQHRDFAMAVRQAAADLNFGLLEQYCK